MCRLLISDVVASLWTPQRLPLTWSNTLLLLIMQRHSTVFPTARPPVRVCCITIRETNRGTQRKPGTRDDACKNVTPLVSSPSASAPPIPHTPLSSFLDVRRRTRGPVSSGGRHLSVRVGGLTGGLQRSLTARAVSQNERWWGKWWRLGWTAPCPVGRCAPSSVSAGGGEKQRSQHSEEKHIYKATGQPSISHLLPACEIKIIHPT